MEENCAYPEVAGLADDVVDPEGVGLIGKTHIVDHYIITRSEVWLLHELKRILG